MQFAIPHFRRIVLLVTDLEIGGTPTVVRELSKRLHDPPRVAIDVACLSRRGPVADAIESAGVYVTALNAQGSADLRVFPRLINLIHHTGYDTVLSFLVHANAAAAAVAPFCPGVRFLQSIQTTQPEPRWHWVVQSLAQHAAERIVVPSPSVARAAEEWAQVPPEKIVVIPNAVDADPLPRDTGFQPVPTAPSAPDSCAPGESDGSNRRHGLKTRVTGGSVPIGFIGRLDPVKRIPDLIHTVGMLNGRVCLHVFGEGSERPRIESQIRRLRLGPMVTLHGAIASAGKALKEIQLLVLPSEAEGFGLVLIEAMASGVPVVATNVAGIRDVVRDGRTGLLVPPGSPRELADAIARILNDSDLRSRLVNEARTDVNRRFSWDAVLPQYRALLEIG